MGKLVESTFISLDGVMSDPQRVGAALLGRRARRLLPQPAFCVGRAAAGPEDLRGLFRGVVFAER